MLTKFPLKNYYEQSAISGWRKIYNWKPGLRKFAKHQHNRRVRYYYKRILDGGKYNEI